jgi:conjugal transfer pilus assembly protein TraB
MAGSLKEQFKERWGNLSPAARTGISLVVLFGGMMAFAALILPANKNAAQNTTAHQQITSETNLIVPQRKDTSLEGLAAGQEAIRVDQLKAAQSQTEKDRQIEDLKKQLADMAGKKGEDQQGQSQEIVREIARLSARQDEFEKSRGAPNLADALPSPGKGNPDKEQPPTQASAPAQPVVPAKPKIRIIGAIDTKQDVAPSDESKPIPYLTSGSVFEGIMINGMDAPTSSITQKNPVPALIRVKTDAILPNRNDLDVKECFVVISGFGVMATERAQLRTESLSCIKESGEVIEAKLDGYVVGEDGKVGLRGRLVSKQGSLLAKSLLAGFLGGFSAGMVPAPVPQMNIAPGLTQQYQTPNLAAAAEAGVAKGLSDSTKMLSQFYLDMAKEMFPVVEIDAGRRVTIILTHGVELLAAK